MVRHTYTHTNTQTHMHTHTRANTHTHIAEHRLVVDDTLSCAGAYREKEGSRCVCGCVCVFNGRCSAYALIPYSLCGRVHHSTARCYYLWLHRRQVRHTHTYRHTHTHTHTLCRSACNRMWHRVAACLWVCVCVCACVCVCVSGMVAKQRLPGPYTL